MKNRKPRVLVGMSGGVDSSVAASLLVESGFDVCGAYMKNWTLDVPGMRCPWADDLAYAKRTAVRLGIDFRVYDFQEQYKREVVDYLVSEYKAGRTPNPDIMCNQEVKFGIYLDAALEDGFDYIATGHYARTDWWDLAYPEGEGDADWAKTPMQTAPLSSSSMPQGGRLMLAQDEAKDQTYFLYRMSQKAVDRTLFPLGGFTKPQVRLMAQERGLPSADKPDSQGICFVGEAGIRDFLGMYVSPQPGPTIDADTGEVVGHHDGAVFFTIGQRKGLGIGGGTQPYYVVGKDMDSNTVYVSTDSSRNTMKDAGLRLGRLSWVAGDNPSAGPCLARMRHGGKLVPAHLSLEGNEAALSFDSDQPSVACGQSVVIYRDSCCLGGGIAVS